MKVVKQTVRKYYKYVDGSWTQQVLTADGTVGGSIYACQSSGVYSGTSGYAYKAFDSSTSTDWVSPAAVSSPQWITYYSPVPLKVTGVVINSTGAGAALLSGRIEGSNDNTNWTTLSSLSSSSATTSATFQNSNYYQYHRIYGTRTGNTGIYHLTNIAFTATQRVIQEGSVSDYDYYKDVGAYKAVEEPGKRYYKYVDGSWTRPNLTANGTMGGSSYAASASSEYGSTKAYHAFDGSTTAGNCWESSASPSSLTFYSPIPIKATSFTFRNYYANTSSTNTPNTVVISGSNDNSTWTQLKSYTNTNFTANSTWTVNITNNNYYNYYRFYVSAGGAYMFIVELNITATQRVIQEGSASDYDFYEDANIYKAIRF